jgi:DNA-binding transcriptional MerR regulator
VVELPIGELAERAGVTRRTVRYYVEIGLLPPPRGAGKTAVYGEEHLERLELIKTLQGYRLSLDEIRDRLAGKPPPDQFLALADASAPMDLPTRPAPYDRSSAAEYIARLRQSSPRMAESRWAMDPRAGKPGTDYEAEQWLRVSLSDDVELHVRRRAWKTSRRLSRLIKEARRILAEEEVE